MVRPGFTLTELLVVITIVAVLAGLLLNGVFLVRDSALASSCASNMRQVYQALDVYRSENSGIYPQAYWDDASYSTWSTWTYQVTSGRWQHVLHDYTESYAVFNCPKVRRLFPKGAVLDSDKGGIAAGAAPGGGSPGWAVCAMAYNSDCFGRQKYRAPFGGQMTEPIVDAYVKSRCPNGTVSRCPVLMDGIWQNDGTNQVLDSWGAYWPHRAKANFVFSDGHAEVRSKSDVIAYNALQIR